MSGKNVPNFAKLTLKPLFVDAASGHVVGAIGVTKKSRTGHIEISFDLIFNCKKIIKKFQPQPHN